MEPTRARILHHLKHSVGDERNIILFVGYQPENTLGGPFRAAQRHRNSY